VPVNKGQLQKDPAPSVPPFDANTFSQSDLANITQGVEQHDLHLLTTGATGLTNCTSDATEPPSVCAGPRPLRTSSSDLGLILLRFLRNVEEHMIK